ncbi:PLP-dependent aminotransferase family protein [Bosea sp. TND4EK4]|uniref:aminotransferase-like domain-containing protein n=1 Tax=Bosea sp. TND4EK4 TaxID=1907408 RepID=UPI0009559F32|nr:PLP-dependent aminotransferase family protein [Bosea sp. TND4EK4]SIQ09762.1 DNA-binding transcriptional regulator, MocR family, contains an aminotransferase domain [Bosea sp. TND4EK4]
MARAQGGRTETAMAAIRARAAGRGLPGGERLPSIRRLAATLELSPSTVAEAYERLVAEGFVRARPGAGYYLAARSPQPLILAQAGSPREQAVDPFWVSRQSLDAAEETLKPGCGWLPAEWMPGEKLRRGLRRLAKADDAVLVDYGNTRGSLALRALLLARFAEEGLAVAPEQLTLTGSGTQAVDLVCRLLLRPGETVLIDDPCYFNFQALLRAHRLRVVSAPYTPTGPDLAAFAAVVEAERPRLYLTNSALHNPTGATLSPQAAHRVLGIAAAHEMMIVEDEIFADFEPEPSARMATLDGLDRVIRIGSFSKTLSASVRCGYVAARADLVEQLVDLQIATSFGGPGPLAARLVEDLLAGGGYRRHLHEVRRRLVQARHDVAGRLEALGIRPWLMPRGGFYLWCRLPDGVDSAELSRLALAEGVVLAPGNVFSAAQNAAGFMRFNVAQMRERRIDDVLDRMMRRSLAA